MVLWEPIRTGSQAPPWMFSHPWAPWCCWGSLCVPSASGAVPEGTQLVPTGYLLLGDGFHHHIPLAPAGVDRAGSVPT